MPFCKQCGNPVDEGQAFCGKCGAVQNPDAATVRENPSKDSFLRYVRGIPFALVFVAFFFPLVVVSCPEIDTEIARYSTYETLDLANSGKNLLGYAEGFSQLSDSDELSESLGEISKLKTGVSKFSVLCVILFVVSAAAFGVSFFQRKVAVCLGVAGAVLFAVIVWELCGSYEDSVSISPGYGFFVGIALYLAGIIMNLLPEKGV